MDDDPIGCSELGLLNYVQLILEESIKSSIIANCSLLYPRKTGFQVGFVKFIIKISCHESRFNYHPYKRRRESVDWDVTLKLWWTGKIVKVNFWWTSIMVCLGVWMSIFFYILLFREERNGEYFMWSPSCLDQIWPSWISRPTSYVLWNVISEKVSCLMVIWVWTSRTPSRLWSLPDFPNNHSRQVRSGQGYTPYRMFLSEDYSTTPRTDVTVYQEWEENIESHTLGWEGEGEM